MVISEKEKQIVLPRSRPRSCSLSLPNADPVHKVSIIPRGNMALGYTLCSLLYSDRYLLSKQELLDRLAVLLGGRRQKRWFLKTLQLGAQDILKRATEIAREMV